MAVQPLSNIRDNIAGDKAGGDKVEGHKFEIGEIKLDGLDDAAAAQWSVLLDIWELATTAVATLAILRDRYGLLSIGVLLMGVASLVSTGILGVLVWALLSHILEVR
jgi:hypothetical protein